jgi:predicted ABC-type ATPase
LKKGIQFIVHFDFKDDVSSLVFGDFTISAGRKIYNNPLAAFIADFLRCSLINDKKKFKTETAFTHSSKIELVKTAKSKVFKTYPYFICTESAYLNIRRVESRIGKGGYGVPSEKIIERYQRSLKVLMQSIPFF